MSDLMMRFKPPGPVAAAFMEDFSEVRCLMGPIGSGKTSTCIFDILQKSLLQTPSPIDGIARVKIGIIRDTYPALVKTVIPSWHKWIPKDYGRWNGTAPMSHEFSINFNGRQVNYIVEFISLGGERAENVMRGWEGTFAYLNEADTLAEDTLSFVRGRLGRYPGLEHGGCTWKGVWMDCNAPDVDNWVYRQFIENPEETFAFFRQPAGVIKVDGKWVENPAAENLEVMHKQSPGYYEAQAKGAQEWYIRRMLENKFGYSRDGKPVYPEFRDDFHTAETTLSPIHGLPIHIGMDAGRTPAAVIGQRPAGGQWRVLHELITEDMGARRFGEELAALLAGRFAGFPVGSVWADPAALAKSDTDESTWIEVVAEATGLNVQPAPSNSPLLRQEAVRKALNGLIDGQPAFLLCPSCRTLRKGFNQGYRYRRMAVAGGARFEDKPDKNSFSHPHDALQYMVLGGTGIAEAMGRKANRFSGQSFVAKTGFNPVRRRAS